MEGYHEVVGEDLIALHQRQHSSPTQLEPVEQFTDYRQELHSCILIFCEAEGS